MAGFVAIAPAAETGAAAGQAVSEPPPPRKATNAPAPATTPAAAMPSTSGPRPFSFFRVASVSVQAASVRAYDGVDCDMAGASAAGTPGLLIEAESGTRRTRDARSTLARVRAGPKEARAMARSATVAKR